MPKVIHHVGFGRIKIAGVNQYISPGKLIILVSAFLTSVLIAYRVYLQLYAFSQGMDSFEPQFELYWMRLFWWQVALFSVVTPLSCIYLWLTREDNILSISPREELYRYRLLFTYFLAMTPVFMFMVIGTEADAAWHQVAIRDTDFTPTHIGLFYFAMPLTFSLMLFGFVWIHLRLPDYHNRVSLPLCFVVLAPVLILPNLGLNEWGHTFFYAEELFAAPIHWGFVLFSWGFYGLTGFSLQCFKRIRCLTRIAK
ncbi:MAG: methane monooxygenase/ammonia monooxygenase subunit C [Gammaproteobacteria bacterium]|nr:MAG: methane monooxygenase/ammonia monooxygenase subunit C [Gammaproteobacteria bacterium]